MILKIREHLEAELEYLIKEEVKDVSKNFEQFLRTGKDEENEGHYKEIRKLQSFIEYIDNIYIIVTTNDLQEPEVEDLEGIDELIKELKGWKSNTN